MRTHPRSVPLSLASFFPLSLLQCLDFLSLFLVLSLFLSRSVSFSLSCSLALSHARCLSPSCSFSGDCSLSLALSRFLSVALSRFLLLCLALSRSLSLAHSYHTHKYTHTQQSFVTMQQQPRRRTVVRVMKRNSKTLVNRFFCPNGRKSFLNLHTAARRCKHGSATYTPQSAANFHSRQHAGTKHCQAPD